MIEKKPRIVIIAGPTAAGKTAVGLELAEEFGAHIVSADSVQV
jgi:tRNA dimethylallyltransferase